MTPQDRRIADMLIEIEKVICKHLGATSVDNAGIDISLPRTITDRDYYGVPRVREATPITIKFYADVVRFY